MDTADTTGYGLPVDILNRQEFVKRLSDILETLIAANSPCTLALNGKWGAGKSFVLTMLEHQLGIFHGGEKYVMFHYNCWQYDYYEEPLLALVAAMLDNIDEQSHLFSQDHREKASQALVAAKKVLKKITVDFIENKFGVDVKGASELYDEIKSGQEEETKKKDEKHGYDHYYTFKQALSGLKEQMQALAEVQPLVVVVDELDRCLPTYATKILERLHHLFSDINNIIVILAIDREQLNYAVEQIFGSDVDTETYLKKFINLEVHLDMETVNEKFSEKYSGYLAMFDENMMKPRLPVDEYFSTLFSEMAVRTQERIMEKITAIHRLLFKDCIKDYSFMCFELFMAVLTQAPVDDVPLKMKTKWESGQFFFNQSLPPAFTEYVEKHYDGHCLSVLRSPSGEQIQINASADILEWVVFYTQVIYGNNPAMYWIASDIPRREEMTAYFDDFRNIRQLFDLIK